MGVSPTFIIMIQLLPCSWDVWRMMLEQMEKAKSLPTTKAMMETLGRQN